MIKHTDQQRMNALDFEQDGYGALSINAEIWLSKSRLIGFEAGPWRFGNVDGKLVFTRHDLPSNHPLPPLIMPSTLSKGSGSHGRKSGWR